MRGCGESHLAQKLGADLVAEPARAAMDADDDIAKRKTKGRGDATSESPSPLVPRDSGCQSRGCPSPRAGVAARDARPLGLGARHAATLLDPLKILGAAVALLDRPMRAACEHASISISSSTILPVLPSPAGMRVNRLCARDSLQGSKSCRLRPVSKRAYAAGDVEPDTACRHDPALHRGRRRRRRRSESRSPSARPAWYRRRRRCPAGTPHCGSVRRTLSSISASSPRHRKVQRARASRLRGQVAIPSSTHGVIAIGPSVLPFAQTSTTHCATQVPSSRIFTLSAVKVAPLGSTAGL